MTQQFAVLTVALAAFIVTANATAVPGCKLYGPALAQRSLLGVLVGLLLAALASSLVFPGLSSALIRISRALPFLQREQRA